MIDPVVFLRRLGKFAFIPLGLLLLLGAAWAVSSTKTWLANAVEVEGRVIEMVRTRDSDNTGYLFAPIVRFQTIDGRTVEFESGLRTNPPAYRTGQTVSVFYDSDEPRSAKISGFFSLWFMPLILGFIAAVFLIVGTAMVVMSGRAAQVFGETAPSDSLAGRPLLHPINTGHVKRRVSPKDSVLR